MGKAQARSVLLWNSLSLWKDADLERNRLPVLLIPVPDRKYLCQVRLQIPASNLQSWNT